MKFRYTRFPYRPRNGQPYSIVRPVIPIGLRYQNHVFPARYEALIDSGADDCLFHAQIGEVIGVNVNSGPQKVFGGMGFGKMIGYLHTVEIQIGGYWLQCKAAFTYELVRPSPTDPGKLEGVHYGILGQEEFFDKFKVIFDRTEEEVELRPKDPSLLRTK